MNRSPRGFTIVELLVVVSVIVVLIGILLPGIGRALDRAKVARSQGNLRNLMAAANTYAADWNDRQFTLTPDNFSKYGDTPQDAVMSWIDDHGGIILNYPVMELGRSGGNVTWAPQYKVLLPISFTGGDDLSWWNFVRGYGWFRHPNCGQFNEYITGRYYDPVFYPPKDAAAWSTLEGCLDAPGEIADCDTGGDFSWDQTEYYYPAGYSFSPAALMSSQVFGVNDDGYEFIDPQDLPSGWRTPAMSQVRFPELKTLMFEHHWLQNAPKPCNPNFGTNGLWDGCEPYYFNHGYTSAPVTLFYDGHIELLGQHEAIAADRQVAGQTAGGTGLWHRQTPMGPDGYFMDLGFDYTETSHNIFTVDGIRGRDKTAR